MKNFTISQVANETNVHKETLRYYERNKLIEKPIRNSSGYRQYSQATIDRIKFIKHAQDVGFSLKEILLLLSLETESQTSCMEIKEFAQKKISEISEKIVKLSNMKETLVHLVNQCESSDKDVCCPIIKAFQEINN